MHESLTLLDISLLKLFFPGPILDASCSLDLCSHFQEVECECEYALIASLLAGIACFISSGDPCILSDMFMR